MFSRQSWLRISTFLVVAIAAASVTSSAQQEVTSKQGTAPETFSGTVNVQVVNVDVHVTDKHGKAVTGLKRSDFELFEDGRPVKITNFYAETGGPVAPRHERVVPPAPKTENAKLSPPGPSSEESAVPSRQRLWVVFFIDNLSMSPPERTRVLRQLHQFVDRSISPGDYAMVVSFDRSLKTLQPFTSDRYSILKAFDEAERLSAEGITAENDRRAVLDALNGARDAADAIARIDSYSGSMYNDVDTTIQNLHDLVHSLAGLKGRKALVFVTDGLPLRAGLDVYYALQQKFRQTSSLANLSKYNSTHSLEELAVQANSSRVVFYTLDAGGLRMRTNASVQQEQLVDSSAIDDDYASNRQASLQLLARQTGGQAIINTNDVTVPMQRVLSDLKSYYSLGFTPAHEGDGRYHRITVKVKRKGITLRYRQGYRDQSVATRMIESTLAAVKYGHGSNPLEARLSVGRISPAQQEGDFVAPVTVEVPFDQLTALPLNDGSRQVQVRLFVVLRSNDGALTPVHQVPVSLKIPAAKWKAVRQRSLSYVLTLTVSPGSQLLAVGVRDEIGARAGVVMTGINAGA